jgi:2,3-bisphosphoglycerate-independent phosphoglycerate mutase
MPVSSDRPNPLVLVILDGFGERAERADNAVRLAKTPNLDAWFARFSHTLIGTSGTDVGLPPGQMGNSEVGHLNFGAGRIAMMDVSRIDNAVFDGSLGANPVIGGLIARTAARKGRLHLIGLASDGGVHSSVDHMLALIKLASRNGVQVVVHAFLDGRDVAPGSAPEFLERLERELAGKGVLGTVGGRFYGMDRDKRWERIELAYRAMVEGAGPRAATARAGVQASYDAKVTDEFVVPFCVGDYAGIAQEDGVLHCNFRPDRARQLTLALTAESFAEFSRAGRIADYACMTMYDASLELPVAFPKESFADTFGECLARAGLAQFRCAETEKFAHVTYFFNGGREAPFDGEERKVVPSPRDVATYDLKPEMSAAAVAREVVAAIESRRFPFILVNFANPDMVGHTGVLDAAVRAVEAVDAAVGQVGDAVFKNGGAMLVTADHGNCELMRDPETGRPHTAHTTNPVLFIYANPVDVGRPLRKGGRICDVAPTMLAMLGLPQPAAMTGLDLREPAVAARLER